ncbi:phospholipase D-like domain-containing protein [Corallococcus sp. AB030]|uniref:phospholipase D-like domain-containing protein n=1 Tax=Corallococcus sp. AB030 TaxID=2316716 RepID=UPI0011E58998|nr:phospholipase D-like domain-containing protein [Corallococcus sp. AB030]
MPKNEIELSEGAKLVITKDEHGPQEVYDRLPTASTAFIVTYNLPKAGGPLLTALEGATQLESLRLVTNIPNWWASYWRDGPKLKAREAIKSSIDRLNTLATRRGVEIYFTRRNHAKIYVVDDIGYVGSSNFSDESASNVEAGVILEDEDVLAELREKSWDLLKADALLHPTLATAVAASLEDWLVEELQFESIYDAVHDSDSAHAQDEFTKAVQRLLDLAHRAEAVLDDARDPAWAEPLQAVIREATSLDEIGDVLGNLEYSYGKIQACIGFSFDGAINQHIVENCSEEENLEWWHEEGVRVAEEQWEELRAEALKDLRRVVDALEKIKRKLLTQLRQLQHPVDNTRT